MTNATKDAGPVLIRQVKPVAFGVDAPAETIDILVDGRGRISALGPNLDASGSVRRVEGHGAWISPGWIDLHAHVWHGGTDISVRPQLCGMERGVTTIVDAGSAGEANFHGFREYIIEPSRERIKAFLNLGSIGLVACNRVSELSDIRSIDIDRIIACYQENREHIVGLKVRASHMITGSWGVTPVKLGKKIAKILKVPMMVHVGEPRRSMTRCWRSSAPATSSPTASTARPAPASSRTRTCSSLQNVAPAKASASTSAMAAPPSPSASRKSRSPADCCPSQSPPTYICAA